MKTVISHKKERIGIVGHGRFGRVLERMFGPYCDVLVRTKKRDDGQSVTTDVPLFYATHRVIWYAVPIRALADTLNGHEQYMHERQLLIDVCSVKAYPKKLLMKLARRKKIRFVLTHPLFGPDSSANGFAGLPIVLCETSDSIARAYMHRTCQRYQLRYQHMSSVIHDQWMARTQFLAHFVGRSVAFEIDLANAASHSTRILAELKRVVTSDSRELFIDMYSYNEYCETTLRSYMHASVQLMKELTKKNFLSRRIENSL